MHAERGRRVIKKGFLIPVASAEHKQWLRVVLSPSAGAPDGAAPKKPILRSHRGLNCGIREPENGLSWKGILKAAWSQSP